MREWNLLQKTLNYVNFWLVGLNNNRRFNRIFKSKRFCNLIQQNVKLLLAKSKLKKNYFPHRKVRWYFYKMANDVTWKAAVKGLTSTWSAYYCGLGLCVTLSCRFSLNLKFVAIRIFPDILRSLKFLKVMHCRANCFDCTNFLKLPNLFLHRFTFIASVTSKVEICMRWFLIYSK